ncbi:MAG: PIN domain-containing protein [Pseudomonadota bacterium]
MNGKRYFLDTNAIIELLKGNKELLNILSQSSYIACSIISILEYQAFSGLSKHDIHLFNTFIKKIETIDLKLKNDALLQKILYIRTSHNLKLPDAIIVGSSESYNCILITADKKILSVEDIKTMDYALK